MPLCPAPRLPPRVTGHRAAQQGAGTGTGRSCLYWYGAPTGELGTPCLRLLPKHVTAPNRNIPITSIVPSLAVGKLVLFGDYLPKTTIMQYCQSLWGPYTQWQNWIENLQLMHLLWRQDTGVFTNRSSKSQSRVKTHGEKYIFLLFPCWL